MNVDTTITIIPINILPSFRDIAISINSFSIRLFWIYLRSFVRNDTQLKIKVGILGRTYLEMYKILEFDFCQKQQQFKHINEMLHLARSDFEST